MRPEIRLSPDAEIVLETARSISRKASRQRRMNSATKRGINDAVQAIDDLTRIVNKRSEDLVLTAQADFRDTNASLAKQSDD